MTIEIKVPSPGESITEVLLASWLVENGSYVDQNQDVAEIDSDKATLSVSAPVAGTIHFNVIAGDTVEVGKVLATIDAGEGSKQNSPSTPVEVTSENKTPEEAKTEEITDQGSKKPALQTSHLHMSPLARKLMEAGNISDEALMNFFSHYRLGTKDIEFYQENITTTGISETKSAGIKVDSLSRGSD